MGRRRAAVVGCVVVVLVALVVISRAVNLRIVRFTTRPAAGARAVTVRLDYVCWGDVTEEALNRHWMAEFEKQHPGTSVNMITTTGGEGTEIKIQTMIAGGAPPDVMYVWPEVFPTFVRKQVYLPLDDMMAQDGVERTDWFDTLIDFYTAGEHIYGLPRSWHPYVLFYNRDMFDQAGVPYPQPEWTWDDVIRYGLKLTRDVDADGNIDQYAIANVPWEIFVWGHGGETYDKHGRCLLETPEAMEGLQLYRDLIWKYRIMPPPQHLTQSLNAQEMFKTGRLGMFGLGIWCVPDFREVEGFAWDIGPMPAGPRQKVTKLVTAGWAIYSGTEHPRESWELVKYLSGPEAQAYQMRIWRDPSGIRQVFRDLMLWEPQEPPQARRVVLDSIEFGRFAATFEGWAEVEQKARLIREELETGRQEDVQEIVRETVEVSREVLEDYRRREREAEVSVSG